MKFLSMTAILFVLVLAWVGQATALTYVTGEINQDITWTVANGPYVVIGQATVVFGRTLTISPGVVVKSDGPGLRVNGTLIADGTPAQPIVFTSLYDDSFGGDTNGDGGATTPARGDWYNLWFSSTSTGNVLDYVMIRYGGGSGSHSLIVDTSSLALSNSTVEESGNDGINAADASPTITGNTIRSNNGHGIWVSSSNATITNNTVSGCGLDGIWAGDSSAATITGNTISMNSSYAIYLQASALNSDISGNILFGNLMDAIAVTGEISAVTTWGSLNAPYVVAAGEVIVSSGVTVTISPGVVVKFSQLALIVYGTLNADGTPEQPIVFTSLKDDSFGGDTNGDGSATTPARGDWYYLYFTPTSVNNVLNHVMIRYGGRANNESLIVETDSLTLSNSTVEESWNDGIYIGATLTITGSVIRNNALYGIHLSDSNATITSSTISGNASFGVYHSTTDSFVVNAVNNYWGDPSGPYHSTNPSGYGDSVSDYVTYNPWLGSDPNLRLSGTVYVEGTSTAIPGASVTLGSYVTTTNSYGYYAFDKILSDNYALDVSKAGFLNYSTTIDVTTSITHDIFLSPESSTPVIVINGGATNTTIPNVTLTLSAPDMESEVSQMRFTNDGITWTDWESYATSKSWTLKAGSGTKTVYVQFQDSAGNLSGIFSDTILLPKFIMDFDGDGKSDIAVWRPGDGVWYIIRSSDGAWYLKQWGMSSLNDVPVPGDYDGDGKTDIAVWRPGDGVWFIIRSSDGGWIVRQWGVSTDVPVPGDYDGDGKTDIAVWRPSDGVWYIIRSSDQEWMLKQWGVSSLNDVPVPGDYDGDGKTDIAVWRPGDGVWFIIRSSDGEWIVRQWGVGSQNDVPISQYLF
ncbi:MAG: hypothetical protein A2156_01575 [Deltaproteobacteria bacterium RBG_16_48_10]|nr:MAG: hypothetical protein A2156_01575 [Deltaproteobacteria bacterium RBG_16_48_10]